MGTPEEEWYKKVCCAVKKHGSGRWYAIGTELGYSPDTVERRTSGKTYDVDKLQVILDMNRGETDPAAAAERLLTVCKNMTPPIIGHVNDELRWQPNNLLAVGNCSSEGGLFLFNVCQLCITKIINSCLWETFTAYHSCLDTSSIVFTVLDLEALELHKYMPCRQFSKYTVTLPAPLPSDSWNASSFW